MEATGPASGEVSLGSMRTVEELPAAGAPVDETATMPPVRSGATPLVAGQLPDASARQPVAEQWSDASAQWTERIRPVDDGRQAARSPWAGPVAGDEEQEQATRRVVGQGQGADARNDADSGHTAVLPPVGGGWSASQALDPATPLADLAKIVQEAPNLRPQVAANPSTYPALLDWLGALGDPLVDAALAPVAEPAGEIWWWRRDLVEHRQISTPPPGVPDDADWC